MALVRNVSSQTIVISRRGGVAMQLLPKRATDLSEIEQSSGQIESLLRSGLLVLEAPLAEASKPASKKSTKKSTVQNKDSKK